MQQTDGEAPRPTVAVNRWLRELPSSGCPSPRSWRYYAQVLRGWLEHLATHGFGPFEERTRLKAALSSYAVLRANGPPEQRIEATTWNQHMSILSSFYRWAVAEGLASAEPFSCKQTQTFFGGQVRERTVKNMAVRRTPKDHVTIKYLEADFAELFLRGLAGLGPDGVEDERFRGRETARNAAVGRLALSTGLRRQEFTYLLAVEVPPLPPQSTTLPVPFPVPGGITKGRKYRTTWIEYEALAELHCYIDLFRLLPAEGAGWSPPAAWGEPLVVTEADPLGGRVNGTRVRWASLRPAERRRLVAPDGGSMLLAVRHDGGPFTAWPTVFARTSTRIRERYEPRFPHVYAHRLRHSFSPSGSGQLLLVHRPRPGAVSQARRHSERRQALDRHV
ncbi:site-specific integrase [Streptomyces sp. NPDC005209]|uniref:site-specific integrase n=1 Tax=Streptomyces sp. NPDC005209 TaxID=3156715 RepID=UPI0033BAC985